MSLLLTPRQAEAWWDDFNSRLIAPCPRPRIIVTNLPKRQDSRWVEAWYRAQTVYLWRGLGGGPRGEWAAFHEYAHHLYEQYDWWGAPFGPREAARLGLNWQAYKRLGLGALGEAFPCALAYLMLGRWRRGCPQVRNLAAMLKPLLKEKP